MKDHEEIRDAAAKLRALGQPFDDEWRELVAELLDEVEAVSRTGNHPTYIIDAAIYLSRAINGGAP